MKLKIYAVVVTLCLLAMIACGGGSISQTSNPGTVISKAKAASFGYPGFGGLTGSVTTTKHAGLRWNGSIIPSAYADTVSTITMNGTYRGVCDATPPTSLLGTTGTVWIALQGLGIHGMDNCKGTSYDAHWTAPTADQAAGNGEDQEPAIGPGTLGQLVVYAVGGGTVKVFVVRGGTPIDTNIQCTFPANGHSLSRCMDATTTFAVQDGDLVVYALGYDITAPPKQITAYVAKS